MADRRRGFFLICDALTSSKEAASHLDCGMSWLGSLDTPKHATHREDLAAIQQDMDTLIKRLAKVISEVEINLK